MGLCPYTPFKPLKEFCTSPYGGLLFSTYVVWAFYGLIFGLLLFIIICRCMEAKNIEKEEKNLQEVPNVDNINFDQIVIDAADEQK